MTLWLANLIAYSLQLAVLVGAAAALAALLRIHRPAAAWRFWQGVFATALLWPVCQVLRPSADAGAAPGGQLLTAVANWASSAPVPETGVTGPRLVMIALAVLVAGALFRLTRIALGMRQLHAIRDAALPASSRLPMAVRLQQELGTRADIRFTAAVSSPATFGALRPTVLLPYRVDELPAEVQHAILSHELLHVRRGDWLATLAEQVWCALVWFHPAARALGEQLAFARETVVDQATIARTGDRRAYAAALLAFAATEPHPACAAALGGRRRFERRIGLIAKESHMDAQHFRLRLCAAAFSVAAATVAATMAAPLTMTVGARTQTVYKPGDGVTLPRVIKEVKPAYTPQAMQARIEGTVWLTAVVLPSGDVGDITVRESLDDEHGLDDEAVRALEQWKFEPGTKDGERVAVEVTVEFRFTLKK